MSNKKEAPGGAGAQRDAGHHDTDEMVRLVDLGDGTVTMRIACRLPWADAVRVLDVLTEASREASAASPPSSPSAKAAHR